jgi:hypothetical protein
MSEDVQREIEDRYQIEEVLRRYCRGVDRGDAALIRSVYHPDATDDHGGFKGKGVEFADRVVEILNRHALATQHHLSQTSIRFEGDMAYTETYVTAYHRIERDGIAVLEIFGGRYVDRFEKRSGEWKIAHRTVVYDWSRINPVEEEYPHETFEIGKRSKDDLSYQSF